MCSQQRYAQPACAKTMAALCSVCDWPAEAEGRSVAANYGQVGDAPVALNRLRVASAARFFGFIGVSAFCSRPAHYFAQEGGYHRRQPPGVGELVDPGNSEPSPAEFRGIWFKLTRLGLGKLESSNHILNNMLCGPTNGCVFLTAFAGLGTNSAPQMA